MTHMWNTMNTFIVFAVTLSVVFADSSPSSASLPSPAAENTSKAEPKNANSIPVVPQKPQTYYTHVPQRNPYITYIQKPYYMPQQPAPPTMVIIAQPALVPQHMIYSHAAQQLLHYFQNNPQARYQFLHGYQPQPTPQAYTQQAAHTYAAPQIAQIPYPTPSPSYANYQYVPHPQYIAAPQHVAFGHSPFQSLPANYLAQAQSQPQAQVHVQTPAQTQVQPHPQTHAQPQPQLQTQAPVSLSSISNYATLAAQQYSQTPIKSAPPIITGFENFTPEQQAQIKEQLSSHFGTSLTHLSGNSLQVPNQQFGAKLGSQSENSQISNDNKDTQSQQTSNNYYRNQYPNKQ